MNKLLYHLKEIINKKELIPKVVSLILAVFLWVYIGSSKIGEVDFRVPIEVKNLSRSLVVSYMPRKSVTLTLNGVKEDLTNVNVKNLKVFVDLQNPVIGEKSKYPVEIVRQQIPEGIDFSLSTNEVTIIVEKRVTKRVKVIPIVSGDVQEGYLMGNVRVTPEYVTISGPASEIADIDSVKTKSIAINNEKKNIAREVSIDQNDLKNIEINEGSVTVLIPVFESSNLQRFSKSIELKNIDNEYTYILIGDKDVNLYVKTREEDARVDEDDFDIYINVSSINIEKELKKTKTDFIVYEFRIAVLNKSGVDIAFMYTVPEKIMIKISKKE